MSDLKFDLKNEKINFKKKQSSLETANEMYKEAFLVKKTRFAEKHPELSEAQINKMTAEYFSKLSNK